MERFSAKNYPMAVKSARKGLIAKDLLTAEYNQMRFLSKKKYVISNERKDASSMHVHVRFDEPRTEPIVREKPLRGYLKQEDYDSI